MPTPRKSESDHYLTGTESQAAVPDAPPVESSRPRCPKDLSPEGKKIFRDVCRELAKRRVLTSGDARIIEVLAGAVERYRRAKKHVEEEGEIVKYPRLDNHGETQWVPKKNMWLDIQTEAEGKIRGLLADLSLNPLNRTKARPTKDESGGIKFL
jgi:P27 family predicted phage terminase small subunit